MTREGGLLRSRGRVLIVEDESVVALDLKTSIERLGFDVVGVVASGEEAVREAARYAPDVVLMDIRLQGKLDGIEAAERIQKSPGAPVIYLTAYADPGTLDRVEASRPYGYLLKPYDDRELEVSLAVAINRHHVERQLALSREELRRTEEKFRMFFEQSRDALFLSRLDGPFLEMSPAGLKLLGFESPEQLRSCGLDDLLPNPKDRIAILEEIERWTFVRDYPAKARTRTGDLLDVLVSASVCTSAQGETTLRGSLHDLTRFRKLESQFHEAQKLEALGRIAGGVAHDFNNLLTVIYTAVCLGRDALPADHVVQPLLDDVEAATRRGATLSSQLLAFGRRQVMEPQILDLVSTVREFEPLLRHALPEHVELVTRFPTEPVRIRVDPTRLEQAVLNLALNAADAMPDGGRLTIEMDPVEADAPVLDALSSIPASDRYVMLVVHDTGSGIPDSIRDQIFEPFFTTKPRGKGTGLGLASTYGIVRQSGGDVVVESAPGAGTTFRIFLPAVADGTGPEPPADARRPLQRGSGEPVLLVENEVRVRNLVATVLRSHGYAVTTAGDGSQALRAIERQGPDGFRLVITDVLMPKLDGIDLVQRLHEQHRTTPVLFVSAYLPDERIGTMPNSRFLPKPFLPATLIRRVGEILRRSSAF